MAELTGLTIGRALELMRAGEFPLGLLAFGFGGRRAVFVCS
ncbi:MAG: hypothetical protein OXG78_07460 [Chloroflexi bacterium]|nr:hypothetical protein [Chloroflexota bacterium]